jgi:hypothetical protein
MLGFRLENQNASREIGAHKQVYDDAGLTPALQNVKYATGAYTRAEVNTTGLCCSRYLIKINNVECQYVPAMDISSLCSEV